MRVSRSVVAGVAIAVLSAQAALAANIPRTAKEFTFKLADGKQAALSQYKGKSVALAFILTSCPHCQRTVRSLIQSQNEFGPSGFQALAVAIDEDDVKKALRDFTRNFNPNFPVGYCKRDPALNFMQHLTMVPARMPLIAFIDREGVIRAQYEGFEPFFEEEKLDANMRAKVKELVSGKLAAPAPKAAAPKK
jgi:thiol-disulfide isomerase/thioredoxin